EPPMQPGSRVVEMIGKSPSPPLCICVDDLYQVKPGPAVRVDAYSLNNAAERSNMAYSVQGRCPHDQLCNESLDCQGRSGLVSSLSSGRRPPSARSRALW